MTNKDVVFSVGGSPLHLVFEKEMTNGAKQKF
jgi:hypothetical protein